MYYFAMHTVNCSCCFLLCFATLLLLLSLLLFFRLIHTNTLAPKPHINKPILATICTLDRNTYANRAEGVALSDALTQCQSQTCGRLRMYSYTPSRGYRAYTYTLHTHTNSVCAFLSSQHKWYSKAVFFLFFSHRPYTVLVSRLPVCVRTERW